MSRFLSASSASAEFQCFHPHKDRLIWTHFRFSESWLRNRVRQSRTLGSVRGGDGPATVTLSRARSWKRRTHAKGGADGCDLSSIDRARRISPGEQSGNPGSPGFAPPPAFGRIPKRIGKSLGEGIDVLEGDQPPGLAVRDDLRRRSGLVGHHRKARASRTPFRRTKRPKPDRQPPIDAGAQAAKG